MLPRVSTNASRRHEHLRNRQSVMRPRPTSEHGSPNTSPTEACDRRRCLLLEFVALLVLIGASRCVELAADTPPKSAGVETASEPEPGVSEAPSDSPSRAAAPQPILEPVRTFSRHERQVRAVNFSPDGKRAVSAGFGGVVRLWEVGSGEQIREYQKHRFQGQSKPVRKAIVSPDGSRILSAGERGLIRSYDVAGGEEMVEHIGHGHNIWAAAIAGDGKHVVSGDQDGLVRFWGAHSGELVWQFDQHSDIVYDVRFSPDGRSILSCSKDRSIRLIDAASGKQIRRFDGHRSAALCGAFSPEMKRILTVGWGNDHHVWDLESGEHLRQFTGIKAGLYDVEYLPSGLAIAAANDGTVRLIDPALGRQLDRVRVHQEGVWSLAVSPDAQFGLSGSADGTAILWRLAPAEVLEKRRSYTASYPKPKHIHTLTDFHAYSRQIAKLVRNGESDELEKTVAGLRESPKAFPSGHSMIRAFYAGTARLNTDGDATDQDFREHIALLQRWQQAAPESLAARLALAKTWRSFAWHARGTGFAHAVSPEAWQRFGQRIDLAQNVLREVAEDPPKDPELYLTRIALARDSGQPKSQVYDLLAQSVEADPTYWHAFATAAQYMMPRWHGSPGEVEQLALDAAKMTEEHLGQEAYARVTGSLLSTHGAALFHRFDFQWNRVRQGFRDALARSPNSSHVLNRYCVLACLAGDRRTAADLFSRLRGRWDGSLWGKRSTVQLWHQWANPNYLQGQQQQVLSYHTGRVYDVAFSPDGTQLASASSDDRLQLLSLRTENERPSAISHRENVRSVAFSPSGKRIATATHEGGLNLWNLAMRQRVSVAEHDRLINDLAFSRDGHFLASASRSAAVELWSADALSSAHSLVTAR